MVGAQLSYRKVKTMSFMERLRAGVAAFSNPPSEGEVAAPPGAAATPTPAPAPAAEPATAPGPWLDRARRGTIKAILILLAAVFLLWLGGKLVGGFLGFITLPLSWIDPADPALSLLYLSNLNVVFSLLYPVLIALGIIYVVGLIFEGRVVVFNDRDSIWPGLPYLTIFLVGGVKCAHTALADWGLWYTRPFVGLLCSVLGFGLVGTFFVARARQARDPKLGFRPVAIARALVAGWYTSMCVLTAVALVGYGVTATFGVPAGAIQASYTWHNWYLLYFGMVPFGAFNWLRCQLADRRNGVPDEGDYYPIWDNRCELRQRSAVPTAPPAAAPAAEAPAPAKDQPSELAETGVEEYNDADFGKAAPPA